MRLLVWLVISGLLPLAGCLGLGPESSETDTFPTFSDLPSSFSAAYDVDGQRVHLSFGDANVLSRDGVARLGKAFAVEGPGTSTTFSLSSCLGAESTRSGSYEQFDVAFGPFAPPILFVPHVLHANVAFVELAPHLHLRVFLNGDGKVHAEYTGEPTLSTPAFDVWTMEYGREPIPASMSHGFEGRFEEWNLVPGSYNRSGDTLQVGPCTDYDPQMGKLSALGPQDDPPLEGSYHEALRSILDDPTLTELQGFRQTHGEMRVVAWSFEAGNDAFSQRQHRWEFLFSASRQEDAVRVNCEWNSNQALPRLGLCRESEATRKFPSGDPMPEQWVLPDRWIQLHQTLNLGSDARFRVDHAGHRVDVEISRLVSTSTSVELNGLSYEALSGELVGIYWPGHNAG